MKKLAINAEIKQADANKFFATKPSESIDNIKEQLAKYERRLLTQPTYQYKCAKFFRQRHEQNLSYYEIARRGKCSISTIYYAIQAFSLHLSKFKDLAPIAEFKESIRFRLSSLYKQLKKAKKSKVRRYSKTGELLEEKENFHDYIGLMDQIRKYEELYADITGLRNKTQQASTVNVNFRDLIFNLKKHNQSEPNQTQPIIDSANIGLPFDDANQKTGKKNHKND